MLQNFKKLTLFPKLHILATRGEKSSIFTIFGRILAILENFLTEKEKITQKVKVVSCRYLWEHGLRFFMFSQEILQNFKKLTCIPKFHILATRGEKKLYFDHFGHISAILEDFLSEKENQTKGKSCILSLRLEA